MRARMRTLYTLTTADGAQWRGDCPRWAATVPEGASLTVTRVLWLGPVWPCHCTSH